VRRIWPHSTAQRYMHLSQAHIRAAVDQIGAKVVQSEEGLDGQSRKLRIDNTPAAQPDRASDGLPPMVSVCACSSDGKSIGFLILSEPF